MKQARNEAMKYSTLYFLVLLDSALDDMVRAGRMTSDVKKGV
jgi:hypothetical protein